MPRPNNFWDVLAETANYAGEAIPAAQRENRQIAQERERFGLRAQQERDQFNETRRYHDAQIGLQGARLNRPQAHPAENPSFEKVLLDMAQNPNKYTPEQIKDFKEAADEFYNMKRPEPQPKILPNLVGDIQGDYEQRLGRYQTRRKAVTTTPSDQIDPKTGYAIPIEFNEPEPTLEGSYNLKKGMFPQYGINPDSIRTELGLPVGPRPTHQDVSALRSRMGLNRPPIGRNTPAATPNTPRNGGYGPDRTFPTEKEYLDAKAMGLVD